MFTIGAAEIVASMPGKVVACWVEIGAKVEAGLLASSG